MKTIVSAMEDPVRFAFDALHTDSWAALPAHQGYRLYPAKAFLSADLGNPLSLQAGIAGALGAAVAFVLASAEAVAVTAKSAEYEMGGIPIVLSALGFMPLAAGLVAGLAAPGRPYPAAFAAWALLLATSVVLSTMPDLRLGAETYLFPAGLNILFVLWGALLTDPSPRRLRTFRDGTLPLAGLMSFLAAIPIADVYFPGKTAWLPLAALVGFFVWLGVRNQRGGEARR